MSDTPKKPGPVPQFKPYPALLRPDQIEKLRSAGPRKGNEYLRDLIDFGLNYHAVFLTFIATRRTITTHDQEPTQ